MFAKIDADCNLDILLNKNCTSHTLELFCNLLKTVPVPDLKLLQVLSATVILRAPEEPSYLPKFPYFKHVCEAIDKCIDESVNQGTWPTQLQGNTDRLQQDTEASVVTATTSLCRHTIDVHKSKQLVEEITYKGMYLLPTECCSLAG